MFMRFVQLKIKPDSVLAFERFYNFRSAPALLEVEGCLFAHLIQSDKSAADFISCTVRRSPEAAQKYESGVYYDELVAELDPFVRIRSFKVDPRHSEEFRRVYNEITTPQILQVQGCRAAFLIENGDENGSVSVTIWDGKDYADFYERSGKFEELFSILRPMLSSLYQWKMALEPRDRARTHSSDDVSVEGYHTLAGVEI